MSKENTDRRKCIMRKCGTSEWGDERLTCQSWKCNKDEKYWRGEDNGPVNSNRPLQDGRFYWRLNVKSENVKLT